MAITGLLSLVIYLLIVGVVIWLILWVLDQIPGIPEPVVRMVRIVVIVIAVLIVVQLLLNLIGGPNFMTLPKAG
jgi:hypothetical protein